MNTILVAQNEAARSRCPDTERRSEMEPVRPGESDLAFRPSTQTVRGI
jgi:hypothetical protein